MRSVSHVILVLLAAVFSCALAPIGLTGLEGQVLPDQKEIASGPLRPGVGWTAVPNTNLASACPSVPKIQGVEGCKAVIADWGSALDDTRRNRLLLWGGGHNGYFGNEWYALDLGTMKMARLTEPSSGDAIADLKECPEEYADGKPNARHTYNGLQYLPKQDLYFLFGAGVSPCGSFSNTVWTFDPSSMIWTRKRPKVHPSPALNGSVPMTAVDPNTGTIYEVEVNVGLFWQYDAVADSWKELGEVSACAKLNMTASIDPSQRVYYCIGSGNFNRIGLGGSHSAKSLAGAGCGDLISASAPGFDYDLVENRMVGWAGGNSVYLYDAKADSCGTQSFAGGPGKEQPAGTYGRFRYFPSLDAFVLVNDWKQNAYILKLPPLASNH